MTEDPDPWPGRALRAGTGLLFYGSLMMADLVPDGRLDAPWLLGAVGLLIPVATVAVWGHRTRPKNEAAWWILGLLAVVGLTAIGQVPFMAGLLVGFFLVHDLQLTPSVMLGGAMAALLIQPGYDWLDARQAEAWLVALGMLLATAAAVLERDRLAWRDGRPVSPIWTGGRVAFVAVWTLAIVQYREQIEAGRVFAVFGAQVTGFAGQMLLLAIILAALVLAGYLFRTRKPPEQAPA
jgi:hypothetical protein